MKRLAQTIFRPTYPSRSCRPFLTDQMTRASAVRGNLNSKSGRSLRHEASVSRCCTQPLTQQDPASSFCPLPPLPPWPPSPSLSPHPSPSPRRLPRRPSPGRSRSRSPSAPQRSPASPGTRSTLTTGARRTRSSGVRFVSPSRSKFVVMSLRGRRSRGREDAVEEGEE